MSDQAVFQTFESLSKPDESGYNGGSDYAPFALREDKSDKGTLEWLNNNFDYMFDSSHRRLRSYEALAKRYQNEKTTGKSRERLRDVEASSSKVKVHNNFFYDYTEKKVSQLLQSPVNMVFIPQDDTTQDDINDAKSCDILVRYRLNQMNFTKIDEELQRAIFKYGSVVARVFFNKDIGPIKKEVRDARKAYGEEIKVNNLNARCGDMDIKIVPAGQIFFERGKINSVTLIFARRLSS